MIWIPGDMHRCKECIRPVCQRKLVSTGHFNGDVSLPMNAYAMHELFAGG